MEVILRDDIEKLGNRGDVVKVADGYARNFLLPKRLAVPATAANKKIVEQERQAHLRREATLKSEAEELAKLLNGVSVTIAQKAGEQEQLFGSVTAKDIAEALEQQNFSIARRKIPLAEPSRQRGEVAVQGKLHREVTAEIKGAVVPEAE
jgi:large subunit ribosomal protein L9